MFEKESAALRYAAALGPAYLMHRFDEQHILRNVIGSNILYFFAVVVLKKQAHFHTIVAQGAFAIITHPQGIVQTRKPLQLVQSQSDFS